MSKGKQHYILSPSRTYYATQDTSKGMIGRYFNGEANSEIAMRWGLGRTVWTAIQPDLSNLNKPIAQANAKFGKSPLNVQAVVIGAITGTYAEHPPRAPFRVSVSPFVARLWI